VDNLEITDSALIPDLLTGKVRSIENAVVSMEGVAICMVEGGKVTFIACDHPRHGCHPKYRESYSKVRELLSRLKPLPEMDVCPKCNGRFWVEATSPEARHSVLLSLMMGMWRGIPFAPTDLRPGKLGDTVGAFLSGEPPKGASSSRTGMAVPGPAFIYGEGEEDARRKG